MLIKNKHNFETINCSDIHDINGNSQVELQMMKIHLNKSELLIINIYCRGLKPEYLKKMGGEVDRRSEGKNFVLTGDFNAHNQLWGSKTTDTQGALLWDWIDEKEMVVLNDGSPTRLDPHHGTLSCIDLSIVNQELAPKTWWGALDDSWGSDHFPICTAIDLDNAIPEQTFGRGGV